MSKKQQENKEEEELQSSLYDKYGERKYLNQSERGKTYAMCPFLEEEKQIYFCLIIHWTGARPSEVLQLRPRQLDISDFTISIKSLKKRGKVEYRHIPVPPFFLEELLDFVKGMDKDEPIFTFSRRTASRYVKKLMNLAGIEGSRACARGMRHGFAVNHVMHEVPLPTIKKLMGHESLETTMIYTEIIGPEELKFIRRNLGKYRAAMK